MNNSADVKLLDCTLRDGGYVNDWKFGSDNIVSMFERIVDSGVDIIEIGFLDDRRPFDAERSIMPDTESVDRIYGSLDRKQAMVFGMIDYGTCAIDNIQPCSDSFLDGIRVIFKKHNMKPAMDFCRQLKKLGYKVCSQLVSITSYDDDDLMRLIDLVNEVKPYAVSMVDTYGLLHPDDLIHYFEMLDEYVSLAVRIGFHGHNNFQLAYANSITFLGIKKKHDIFVDGTLYGMGKSAGNAPIELVAMRLNEKYEKHYNINQMLEAIEESIMPFYSKSPWGYNTFFYLSGLNHCHPKYVSYFKNTNNLSVSKVNSLLSNIEPTEKKLLYDENIAADLYSQYIAEHSEKSVVDDFASEINGRKILLIGPGRNIRLQQDTVKEFIDHEDPYIISINYIPNAIKTNCVFVTNGKRYHDMTLPLKEDRNCCIKFLATSNVECRNGKFDFTVNRSPLLEKDEEIIDNSFLMLLKFLIRIKIPVVYCAGFDGYSDKEDNYLNPGMEYKFIKQEAPYLNKHMKKVVSNMRKDMQINFITYSAYDTVEDINSAAI